MYEIIVKLPKASTSFEVEADTEKQARAEGEKLVAQWFTDACVMGVRYLDVIEWDLLPIVAGCLT